MNYALKAAEHRVKVAKGLIEMRRAGLLQAVHIDAGLIAIVLPGGARRRTDWAQAEALVEEYRSRERPDTVADNRRKAVAKTPVKTTKSRIHFR